MQPRHRSAIVILALACAPAAADERWALCPAWPEPTFAPGPDAELPLEQRPLRIFADSFDSARAGESLFSGNVTMQHGARTLTADELRHDRVDGVVAARGRVLYGDPDLEIGAGGAEFHLGTIDVLPAVAPTEGRRGLALHPFGPQGPANYRYVAGDTVRIAIRGDLAGVVLGIEALKRGNAALARQLRAAKTPSLRLGSP
jgi:hypothetical protein